MNQHTYLMAKRLEEAGYGEEDIKKIFAEASFYPAVGIVSRRIRGISEELAWHLARWKLREDQIAAEQATAEPKSFHGHAGKNIKLKKHVDLNDQDEGS